MDDNPWRYHIVQIHGPDQHSLIPALMWGYGIYDSHKECMRDLPIMRTRAEVEEKLAQLDPHRELSMDHSWDPHV